MYFMLKVLSVYMNVPYIYMYKSAKGKVTINC